MFKHTATDGDFSPESHETDQLSQPQAILKLTGFQQFCPENAKK